MRRKIASQIARIFHEIEFFHRKIVTMQKKISLFFTIFMRFQYYNKKNIVLLISPIILHKTKFEFKLEKKNRIFYCFESLVEKVVTVFFFSKWKRSEFGQTRNCFFFFLIQIRISTVFVSWKNKFIKIILQWEFFIIFDEKNTSIKLLWNIKYFSWKKVFLLRVSI